MEHFIKLISQEKVPNNIINLLKFMIEKFIPVSYIETKENQVCFILKDSLYEEQLSKIINFFYEKVSDQFFFETSVKVHDLSDENMNKMLEDLAKFMHNAMMKEKLEAGWRYGESFSTMEKTSPLLIDYDRLPSNMKQTRPDIFAKVLELYSKNI